MDRPHLLAPGIAEKGAEFLLLEASEPPKSKVGEHIRWKDKLSALRKELGADISSVASQSRLVATTVSSAITWNETFREAGPWHFVICDEGESGDWSRRSHGAGNGSANHLRGRPLPAVADRSVR